MIAKDFVIKERDLIITQMRDIISVNAGSDNIV